MEVCFECGEEQVKRLSERELGNPQPEEVKHYECKNCGAWYTEVDDDSENNI